MSCLYPRAAAVCRSCKFVLRLNVRNYEIPLCFLPQRCISRMDVQDVFQLQALNTSNIQTLRHHILSGSFRSFSLFLLAFSPSERSISHLETIPAFGPHQYLAANQHKTRVFATSWALPPSLSSWEVERADPWRVMHLNSVPISMSLRWPQLD